MHERELNPVASAVRFVSHLFNSLIPAPNGGGARNAPTIKSKGRQEEGSKASIYGDSGLIAASAPEVVSVSKEDLGKGTWTLLHSIAAQYPDHPTKQQRKDVHDLIDILTRVYPCETCAKHFKDIVRNDPPAVSSRADLEQWMCRTHNIVNRSLNKPAFNCTYVQSRWGIDCGDDFSCNVTLGETKPKSK
ncbi:hypothetical protein BSKO_13763 [Bryopsis sp. KO-2023]|nr:hypothetical protein BSKO_13763 [Bryopsis sp. KO-2023]